MLIMTTVIEQSSFIMTRNKVELLLFLLKLESSNTVVSLINIYLATGKWSFFFLRNFLNIYL